MRHFSKIIYFDRETIQNTLQQVNRGVKVSEKQAKTESKVEANLNVETTINLGVPIWDRFKFLLTGKIGLNFLIENYSKKTVTSTELSEFYTISERYEKFKKIKVKDIENSSTFFRVAGGYMSIISNNHEDINVTKYKEVMESFDGYDTYMIDDQKYIRFNTEAFISNYRRNELLITEMDVYCVETGRFNVDDFDFLVQINKMQNLFKDVNSKKTLADLDKDSKHSVTIEINDVNPSTLEESDGCSLKQNNNEITLYDVVLAEVRRDKSDKNL